MQYFRTGVVLNGVVVVKKLLQRKLKANTFGGAHDSANAQETDCNTRKETILF